MEKDFRGINSFETLPKRVFLDSCILQIIFDYGECVFENIEPKPTRPIFRIPGGYKELRSIQDIFFVNQRAQFEFALSRHSVNETAARGNSGHFNWVLEVMNYWERILEDYENSPFSEKSEFRAALADHRSLGYLSQKDRLLLKDALSLECEAFLTIDYKLLRNSAHLNKKLGLRLFTPSEYWDVLKPWAGLYV